MMPRNRLPYPAFLGVLGLSVLCTGCPVLFPPLAPPDAATLPATQTPNERSLENNPPVADAGASQTVTAGQKVVLNGAASTDPNGDQLLFFWRQVEGTPTIDLSGSFSSAPTFAAPTDITQATTFKFRLLVSDGFASSSSDVSIIVQPAP